MWLKIFPYWHFSYLVGVYSYIGLLSQKTENTDFSFWAHCRLWVTDISELARWPEAGGNTVCTPHWRLQTGRYDGTPEELSQAPAEKNGACIICLVYASGPSIEDM